MATRSSKSTNSEDKIRELSLYHHQGLQTTIEGLPAEVLKLLEQAKLKLVLRDLDSFRTPANPDEPLPVKLIGHAPILVDIKAGVLRYTVPNIYPDNGPEVYDVCGHEFPLVSFVFDRHVAWQKHQDARGMTKNLASQSEIEREIKKNFPSDEEMDAIRKQLPKLRETVKSLIANQSDAYLDLEKTPEDLEKIAARITLTNTRIKTLEERLNEWDGKNDVMQSALNSVEHGDRMQELKDEFNMCFLEFAHQMAVEDFGEEASFDDWKKHASGMDYANAVKVVSEGNAYWMSGAEATPLSRADRRQRQRDRVLN